MAAEPKVLVLGGTAQGRRLASVLVNEGFAVVSSLAGRTRNPVSVAGEVRVGGFGGVDGLVSWLQDHPVAVVVNATHPFAGQMSANAAAATKQVGVPLLRLTRLSWAERGDAGDWTWVDSHDAAAQATLQRGKSVLLAVGRQSLNSYHSLSKPGVSVLARVADASGLTEPVGWTILESRGPFTLESERELMDEYGIDVVVTKDSGGDETAAKLDVCAERNIPIVMVARPSDSAGTPIVVTVSDAVEWVRSQIG